MKEEKIVIKGFTIEVYEQDGVCCTISKGRVSSSLAVADDFGCLDPDSENTVPVPADVIEAATEFACKHGY